MLIFFLFLFSLFFFFFFFFFFFSSRRRHTRYIGDWSFRRVLFRSLRWYHGSKSSLTWTSPSDACRKTAARSEERRVGKECRSRWWAYDEKKKRRRKVRKRGKEEKKKKELIDDRSKDRTEVARCEER